MIIYSLVMHMIKNQKLFTGSVGIILFPVEEHTFHLQSFLEI